jgi:PAS domain S-box-containing protein
MPFAHLAQCFGSVRARWQRLPAWARRLVDLVLLGAINLGLCVLGIALTPPPVRVALFWPSAGLGFGALAISPRRRWPALLLATGLPIALFNAWQGLRLPLVLTFAASNALEAALAAAIVLRFSGGRPRMGDRNHVLAFVLGGPVATSGLCALLGAAVLASTSGTQLLELWRHLWAGSGLGMLVVGALVLTWAEPPVARAPKVVHLRLEWLGLGVACLLVAYLVSLASRPGPVPYTALALPPLIWTALRYGLRGTTAVGFGFVVVTLASAVLGRGVFGAPPGARAEALVAAQVFSFVVFLTDLFLASAVEDRARAALALQASEEKYRILVENQTDLVVKVDAAGRLLFVSPSYCRMFGKSEAELLGTSARTLIGDGDREAAAKALAALARPPHTATLEQRVATSTGPRWLSWAAKALVGPGGALIEIVAVGRDVTERKQIEARLRQSEKLEAIGRLAGGVAHDFNNQLSAILASAEYAGSLPLPEEARETLDTIRESARRSAGLTRQLLALSRKEPPRTAAIDAARLLGDVVELLARSIDKRVAVQLRTEGPALLSGDPDRLHAAVLNLALNGRDAMPEGGTLTLSARPVTLPEDRAAALGLTGGRHVELSVADTGVGMSEETRGHLFEPFFTTKAAGKGLGLGLAEVYGTVKAHRGAVTVTSAPGRGTTFTLLLPAIEAATEPARPAPPALDGQRVRVLIVDDEPNVRRSLSLLLRLEGCEVIESSGGPEALALVAHRPDALDLAIVDMIMPEMGGRQVVAELRGLVPHLPVIVSSGYSPGEEIAALCAEPRTWFLQKPYTREQLVQALAGARA